MPRKLLYIFLTAVVAIVGASLSSATAAAAFPKPGSTGWDVSYIQCGTRLPADGSFAVVGVNRGLPWSVNQCLQSEWAWAASRQTPALYMNTANPAPSSSFYWPASGATDPVLCRDNSSVADPGCAYDYGWHAAAHALSAAREAIGSAADSVPWWLDVETANSWNGTPSANAADIQGSIDYLRSQGVPAVGLYSTQYQWGVIAGGYSTTNAGTFIAEWSPEFAPLYPIGESPNWVAGVSSLKRAQANCANGFSGGPTLLAQYRSKGLDGDLSCGAAKQSNGPG